MAWRLLVVDRLSTMRHLACLLIFVAAAVPARAQSGGKFAVGANIGTRFAPSPTVGGDHFGIGLLWRIGHSKEGFGWEWGLNWFTSDVDRSLGGLSEPGARDHRHVPLFERVDASAGSHQRSQGREVLGELRARDVDLRTEGGVGSNGACGRGRALARSKKRQDGEDEAETRTEGHSRK